MNKNILEIFSKTDVEGIAALIAVLEKSAFDYLKLEDEGIRLVIGKNGFIEADEIAPIAASPQLPAIIKDQKPDAAAKNQNGEDAANAPAAPDTLVSAGSAQAVQEGPGILVVKAPSYGLFYAQSNPDSPPYVSIGSKVKKGDTLGLLEIMKTYYAITSDIDGEVIAIYAKNEAMLEPDQPLFSIKAT